MNFSFEKTDWGYYLYCDYNIDFIDELKSLIPQDEIKWNQFKRCYWISDAWYDEAKSLVDYYLGNSLEK
jgi:hypothetical protein